MKYTLSFTSKFKRDFKAIQKRNYDLSLIEALFLELQAGKKLPAKFGVHKLSGSYDECWECHIKPDWLLIWRQNEEAKEIQLVRTGTHSDLFR